MGARVQQLERLCLEGDDAWLSMQRKNADLELEAGGWRQEAVQQQQEAAKLQQEAAKLQQETAKLQQDRE